MKKLLVLIFAVGIVTAGMGFATAGNSGTIQPVKGIGAEAICDGTPFTITGVVVEIGIPGEGMALDTGISVVTIYGIGSPGYWAANLIDRPEVGELVTVTGYIVDLTDRTLNIAASITLGGMALAFRDPVTCVPLWRPAQ